MEKYNVLSSWAHILAICEVQDFLITSAKREICLILETVGTREVDKSMEVNLLLDKRSFHNLRR